MKLLHVLLVMDAVFLMAMASTPSCPADNGASPVYIPDDSDPTGFWECSNGQAWHFNCADGLVWNANANVCDWPDDASKSAAASPKCPEDNGASPVYFPDESNPNGFWECSNGQAYHFNCADGLVWNANGNVCDWPDDASKSAAAASSPKCPEDNGASPVYFPDESNPNGFWECSNGQAYHFNCADGLVWNANGNVCDWPDDASKSAAAASSPKCPEDNGASPVYFPDEANPNGFWECSNGQAWHFNCAAGLVWNSNARVCDWPQMKK